MRKAKKASLDVLAKSSEVYNCWSILDEAVTCGDDDVFTHEYIEGERMMLMGAVENAVLALTRLGREYGIDVDALVGMRDWEAK